MVVWVGEGHRVIGDDSSNVYKKCAGRPIWCGAFGDDRKRCIASRSVAHSDSVWIKYALTGCSQTGIVTSSARSKCGDELTSSGTSRIGGGNLLMIRVTVAWVRISNFL